MKKLKGDYSAETTYSVGDVVRYSNGNVYHLQRPAKAGVPPTETLYWGAVEQKLAEAIIMVLDGVDLSGVAMQAAVAEVEAEIPANLNESVLILKSSTEGSTKEFAITVDDEGELSADEIVPDGGD